MRLSLSHIVGILRRNFRLWAADLSRSGGQYDALMRLSLAGRRARYEELREQRLQKSKKILAGYGYKVFSQSDEDGIIAEIFRRIGMTNRVFVEFGVGNGLENNTVALLYQGWSGLWIEGSSKFCEEIRSAFGTAIENSSLSLVNEFVTPENINTLISMNVRDREIDILSVDIDGNDAHVLSQIKCVSPRVLVIEYNAKLGPLISYCMAYDANYHWTKTDRFGASLKFFETMLDQHGYFCVGCNVVGTNAFFVRKDLVGELFASPFTAEEHFEPARYELVGLPSGHPCSADLFGHRVTDEAGLRRCNDAT